MAMFTEQAAKAAAKLLKDAGPHGHKHAVDATVAEVALRQPGPVAMFTSDVDDMRRCAANGSGSSGCEGHEGTGGKDTADRPVRCGGDRPAARRPDRHSTVSAARIVCWSSSAVVTGPTPPGTGVTAAACRATAGSTSPTRAPSSVGLVPTSMITVPA